MKILRKSLRETFGQSLFDVINSMILWPIHVQGPKLNVIRIGTNAECKIMILMMSAVSSRPSKRIHAWGSYGSLFKKLISAIQMVSQPLWTFHSVYSNSLSIYS